MLYNNSIVVNTSIEQRGIAMTPEQILTFEEIQELIELLLDLAHAKV